MKSTPFNAVLRPALLGAVAVGAAVAALSGNVAAELSFEVSYADSAGTGFFDDTPVADAPGNPGSTLGEQRRTAFEYALGIWAEALDSAVPIAIEARFSQVLSCDESSAVLGGAAPTSLLRGFAGAPRGDRYYASALADRLAGRDLDPGNADIAASFNPALDAGSCLAGTGWDYSLGTTTGTTNFVNTALHELAHGLGFTNGVDPLSGSGDPGFTPFDGLLFDRQLGRYWDQMTPQERMDSARKPLQLVWAGSEVNRRAAEVLALGAPYVDLSVFVSPGQSEVDARVVLSLVAEVNRGPRVSLPPVQAPLLVLPSGAACGPLGDVGGAVILLTADAPCAVDEQLLACSDAGAAAVLLQADGTTLPPSPPRLQAEGIAMPILVLGQEDFERVAELANSGLVGVLLGLDEARFAGADSKGRVLMNASDPVRAGSSLAHWDGSTRRPGAEGEATGLLMEPVVRELVDNDVSELTVQLLRDVGWADSECGNGELEPGEGCDDGADNSDSVADACRVDCRSARCGDGVVDSSEQCDDGPALGDCPRDCGRQPDPLPPAAAWEGGIEPIEYQPPTPDAGGPVSGPGAPPSADAGVGVVRDAAVDVRPDAGDSRPEAGVPAADAASPDASADGPTDAGASADAGDAGVTARGKRRGCGCRLVGVGSPAPRSLMPLLAGVLVALRRRRRRQARGWESA